MIQRAQWWCRCALGALLAGGIPAPATAQSYPAKPVRFIVPYPPGGLDASSEQGSSVRDATVRESAAAAVLIAQASIPLAQYPNHPVRFIVPYPPGGGTDVTARPIATRLAERWGQSVLVDNRSGGNGRTRAVNRVPACGM